MLLAEGKRFGVVTEGEFVLAILALIDLIREAAELALVRIELPLADKGIVVRERDWRSAQAESAGVSGREPDAAEDRRESVGAPSTV